MKEEVRGYKAFNPDWTCREYEFEVGNTYKEDVKPECCSIGFHFCLNISDCFNYYSFNSDNKVAEVIALGDVDYSDDNSKCCTNKIRIVRELSWEEVLKLANTGKDCTGYGNTGNRNTGNRNTGNRNTGYRNTGNRNTGDWNTGNWNISSCNTGNRNTGDRNTGNWNAGDWNTGDRNTGNRNTGNWNAGDWNTGDRNTGNRNTGDRNTGNRNTGDRNTGDRNTGYGNTGDWNTGYGNTGDWNTGYGNTGDRNTGDWNISSCNTGNFMTTEQKIMLFNKGSDLTYMDWINSDARYLLNQIKKNVVEWIYEKDMTDEEKEENQTYKTTGGYLKVLDESECAQLWWNGLSDSNKKIIKAIPNFDNKIFKECTGIETNSEVEDVCRDK